MTCDELRAVAVELALDDVTGEARAAALAHLATCDTCRALVADLALVADALLLTAPEQEPPAGFESRVLARMQPVVARSVARRRLFVAAAAAIVAALVGVGVGISVSGRDAGHRSPPIAAVFTSASTGRTGGTVVLADAPDRMTCTFEDAAFGGAYRVDVRLRDGTTTTVGRFRAGGAPWSWTVALPVDVRDVRAVLVRSDDGVVRLSAKLT